MASGAYGKGVEQFLAGNLDWDAGVIAVMAVSTGFTLDKDNDQYLSDVSAHRYSGAADQKPSTPTNTIDTVNNRVEIGYEQQTYSALSQDGSSLVGGFVTWMSAGTGSTQSPLIAFDDTANVTPNGTDVSYTPNTEGLVQFDYGA